MLFLNDDTDREECAVCFDEKSLDRVRLRPCGHMFCRGCVDRGVVTRGLRCPLCRTLAVRMDPPVAVPSESSHAKTASVHAVAGTHAGLTVTDDPAHGCVRVTRAVKGDLAFRNGVRKGRRIVGINGFPAVHHRDVIAVVQRVCDEGGSLELQLRLSPRRRRTAETSYRRTLQTAARDFHDALDEWTRGHTPIS